MKRIIYCVVVNYNDFSTCEAFVENNGNNNSIEKIIFVDNNSSDDSYNKLIKNYNDNPKIDVIKCSKNGGYGYGNNFGIRYCFEKYKPSHIIISNPDVKFNDCTVYSLCDSLDSSKDNLIAAPLMKQKDGSIGNLPWSIPSKVQYIFLSSIVFSNNSFRNKISDFDNKDAFNYVDCVSGAFLMVKAFPFLKDGLYDENVFLYCEETLIGIKYKKEGYKTVFLVDVDYYHLGSESINKTFNSEISKLKITLKSRYYVLRHYYNIYFLEIPIIKLIFWIQIVEWSLYLKLRKYIPWKRKK